MGWSIHDVWDCTITMEGNLLKCIFGGFSDSVFLGLYGALDNKYTFRYAGADDSPDAITGLFKYADFRGAKGKIPLCDDSGYYYSLADYRTVNYHSGFICAISDNYAGYYIARQHLYFSTDEYKTVLCSPIDDTHCFYCSVDFLQKADVYGVIDYVGVRDIVRHVNVLI